MQDFIKISKYAGMRNDLAQAGYSRVDYRKIVEYFREYVEPFAEDVFTEEKGNQLLKEAQIEGGRASIETFLHAITGKYTLHSHPLLVNILTAREDAEEIVHELFPKAVFVPYRKPGAALAEAYDRIYRAKEAQGADGTVVFLQNHGLVVSELADGEFEKMREMSQSVYELVRGYDEDMYDKLIAAAEEANAAFPAE